MSAETKPIFARLNDELIAIYSHTKTGDGRVTLTYLSAPNVGELQSEPHVFKEISIMQLKFAKILQEEKNIKLLTLADITKGDKIEEYFGFIFGRGVKLVVLEINKEHHYVSLATSPINDESADSVKNEVSLSFKSFDGIFIRSTT